MIFEKMMSEEEQKSKKMRTLPELKPHEIHHLFLRRLFVFADEWLSYFLLIWLYVNHLELFFLVMPMVIICNYIGYLDLWELRRQYGILPSVTGPKPFFTRIIDSFRNR